MTKLQRPPEYADNGGAKEPLTFKRIVREVTLFGVFVGLGVAFPWLLAVVLLWWVLKWTWKD